MSDHESKRVEDSYNFLCQAELDVSKQFDQYVIGLAGGAIALSMTYATGLAGAQKTWLLLISWLLLALSILSILMSLAFSQEALRKQRDINMSSVDPGTKNWFASVTNFLNWISLIAVTSGILIMCIFVTYNTK